MTAPSVTRLRCEHLPSPVVLDRQRPRFSWQVTSPRRGASQSAYQVLVGSSGEHIADVWDSGKVVSDECVLVPYAGRELLSREQLFWTVQVWDDEGTPSSPSAAGAFEMGLLAPSDWQAEWIASPRHEPSAVTLLRSTLRVDAPVVWARAYVTALGVYELHCNGQRVGDAHFAPGWTDYTKRLQYQVLDLTDLLIEGDNELTAELAEGWYAGYIGFQGTRHHYGQMPQLLAQIEVETDTGTVVHLTGQDWLASTGTIRSSDMLKGEHQDLGRTPGPWLPVQLAAGTPVQRVISAAPPVRVLAELPALSVERIGTDTHRVDLGQNLVGWLRLRLTGAAGSTVTVRHAEILRPDGSLYLDNLRTATATDSYVLDGRLTWVEPRFTFHGFRYAEVTGYPGELCVEDVIGVVCGSDLEQVGEFACSDEAINQLHSNIGWSARGNFFDIPTDCPQRDERMGWTGDAQVFAPTAAYLLDTAAFFTKWLRDLVDGQTAEGSFPDVAPLVVLAPGGSAGWADAGVIVPSVMWERYADRDLLAELYPAMRAWVDHVHGANPGLLWLDARGYDNGDWLQAHAECETGADAMTYKELLATAYFARSTRLTAEAADVLGRAAEAAELHQRADAIRNAFCDAYLLPGGRLVTETQTAYALALRFELIPADLVPAAAARLAANVTAHDTHLTTGFLGVGQLLPALTDAGYDDLAYRLLHQDAYPSWLHAVRAGATTIWERWDGWTAEAGYGNPEMNSYNHYALGSVGEWLYGTVAGIGYAEPAGRRLVLAPRPHPSLTWVRSSHLCPYGLVRSEWLRGSDGALTLEFEVPVGATATVRLPDSEQIELGSGTHVFHQRSQHDEAHSTKGSCHAR